MLIEANIEPEFWRECGVYLEYNRNRLMKSPQIRRGCSNIAFIIEYDHNMWMIKSTVNPVHGLYCIMVI